MPAFSMLAGREAAKGARRAQNALWEQYQQIRKDLAPWVGGGADIMEAYAKSILAGPGAFAASPGYEFRQAEGQRAVNSVYSAAGALGSGAHKKALIEYGQNFASNEYNNFLNQYYQRLNSLYAGSGMGLQAAGLQANAGLSTALGRANALQSEGNARASMWSGIGSSLGTGIGFIASGGLNGLFSSPAAATTSAGTNQVGMEAFNRSLYP